MSQSLANSPLEEAIQRIMDDTALMRQLERMADGSSTSSTITPNTPDALNTGFVQVRIYMYNYLLIWLTMKII